MKIMTDKDIAAAKDPKRRRARLERAQSDEIESAGLDGDGLAKFGYLDELMASGQNKQLHFADQWKEEEKIRDTLAKAGMLQFDEKRGTVRDARIPPATEKKLLEFASQLTRGNSNLIVEMADRGYSVYNKESSQWGKKEYVTEFAEYPRRGKNIVETGDKHVR